MVPTFLLAGLLAAQLGGGGGAATTTTVPTTTVPRTTTTVLVTTTTPAPPPTAPPTTGPPPDPGPAPTPAPTPPPATAPPPRPTVGGTTPPGRPSVDLPGQSDPSPAPDAGEPAPDAGPDASSPPSPPGSPAPILHMDKPSSEPGGVVVLTGEGCAPGAPVTVQVGDVAVGSIPGRDDGGVVAVLTLPDLGPGRYDIRIDCGPTFTMPIDVVVATSVESPNSVLALFVFFVLLALVLFRRRRIHPDAVRRSLDPGRKPRTDDI